MIARVYYSSSTLETLGTHTLMNSALLLMRVLYTLHTKLHTKKTFYNYFHSVYPAN